MGKKKRSTIPAPSAIDPASEPPISAVKSLTPVIKREGLKTMKELQNGNYVEALNLIKKSIEDHQDSSHLHSVKAVVHMLLAEKEVKDSGTKIQHLADAMESAQLASTLLPSSVYFALLLVDIRYQLTIMKQEKWDDVTKLCWTSLQIENSTDPGVDRFLEENEMVNSSKESRIEDTKKQINKYFQASKRQLDHQLTVEMIENQKIFKGDGVLMADAAATGMRMNLVEAKIGEWIIKKQRTSHAGILNFKGNVEKAGKHKRFWSSNLSSKEKRDFRRVGMKELEKHLKSLRRNLALDFLKDISFAKEHKTWKWWECCHQMFGDCNMYRDHYVESHGLDINFLNKKIEVSSTKWNEIIEKWPFHVDDNREEILQKIRHTFLKFLKSNCLTMTLLFWTTSYALKKCMNKNPRPQICPENLTYLSSLGASDLERILEVLNKVGVACGLTDDPEMDSSYLDDILSDDRVSEMKERVVFSEDFSCLLVDERLMEREFNVSNYIEDYDSEDKEGWDDDDLLSWLYESQMIAEDLESRQRDYQKEKAKELNLIVEAESSYLRKILKEIHEVRNKINAIKGFRLVYNREKISELVPKHYVNLLRQRGKDIQGNGDINSKIESEVISHALGKALAAEGQVTPRCDQPGFEECVAEEEMPMPEESLEKIDNGIRVALRKMLENSVEHLLIVEAKVMMSVASVQRHEHILKKLCVYDYQPILVPFLKSFLQARLEDLYNKDEVLKKYDEQIDTIAAVLSYDDKKSVDKGCDGVQQKQDGNKNKRKKKKKKKNKNCRNTEVFKKIDDCKDSQLYQIEAEDDNLNSKIVESADEFKQQIETEERLLEKMLDNWRQFEHESSLKANVLGTILKNEDVDCFLNVVIQSLWNLREFREEFVKASLLNHKHIGNPCVICTLLLIFATLSTASVNNQGEVVAPLLLIALRAGYHGKNNFQEGQKNDASEFLHFILESLHESFNLFTSNVKLEDKYECCMDCFTAGCFVHTIFGMDHFERINCLNCHLGSRHRKYTSRLLILNARNLRMKKNSHGGSSFDELLKLLEMNGQLACEVCKQMNSIYYAVWCLPPIFTIVLHWEIADESSEDISSTLSALETELDLSKLFQGYEPGHTYFLVSMVCFSGDRQHYICFVYSHKHEKYVQYGATVEITGSWAEVVSICNAMCLKPQILFFHRKSSKYFGD